MKIVYILTNECMPETIKIGATENLEQRMKQLDNTSVALPFECFYAVEVEDASVIERKIHQGLENCRIRDNREFFNVSPDQAKSLLEIAELMGGKNVTPSEAIVETSQDLEALRKAKRRQDFKFQMLGIEKGTVLEFKRDRTITCEAFDDSNKVMFRGEVKTLSNSAHIVLQEMGFDWGGANGTLWWCLGGKTLNDLRSESES